MNGLWGGIYGAYVSVHYFSLCVSVVYGFGYVYMIWGWSVHRLTCKVNDVLVCLLYDGGSIFVTMVCVSIV